METLKKLPLFFICFFTLFFLPSEAYPVIKEVSVLLEHEASQGTISGVGMRMTDAGGAEAVLSGTHNIHKIGGTRISAGGRTFKMPLKISSENLMKYNGTSYSGTFILKNSANGFTVSNVTDLEEYLRGVIKAEMDPRWPFEALKAQVILARTFAVNAGGKHGDDDLCDSWHCQVYKGISAQDSIADRAVRETSGLILKWKERPASVYYHSDSGGMVTSSANVWGGDTPYLRPKAEPFPYSGRSTTWEAALSLSYIRSKLESCGINVGNIISITPLKRDETGRVLNMEIKGTAGSKIISGYKFRNTIGAGTIKSTLFEFGSRSPYINEERSQLLSAPVLEKAQNSPKDVETSEKTIDLSEMPEDKQEKIIWLTEKRVFTTLELMEMLSRPDDIDSCLEKGIARAEGRLPMPDLPGEVRGTTTDDPGATEYKSLQIPEISYVPKLSMASASGRTVKIFGRGSGHGVGFSQIGAKTMAENGWNFTQILGYYFPGTTIGQ